MSRRFLSQLGFFSWSLKDGVIYQSCIMGSVSYLIPGVLFKGCRVVLTQQPHVSTMHL